jgi:poly(3-hydroxybutyrate) depolymerase
VLHTWLDWQRSLLSSWLELGRLAGASHPLGHLLHPPRELLARTLAAGTVSERPLDQAVKRDAPFPVRAEVIRTSPFVRLVHLQRPGPQRQRFLLLAPYSGYATSVISPLATSLVAMGEVIVTEWTDARLVPLSDGAFGLAEQIAVGREAATALGAPAHLVGLSQSGPTVLALAAILAEETPALTPASLAFLGCQLDPKVAPNALQQMLAQCPRDLLVANLTTVVGSSYPGVGRRVYPSLLQLMAYSMASPQLYSDVQHGLWLELIAGQAGGVYDRQHADIHSLLDVPGELFLDMLDWVVDPSVWDGDRLVVAGRAHDLAPLRGLPALTLESRQDELVGAGQTHALNRRLRSPRVQTVTLPDGRHHDLFTGPGFLNGVAPALQRFYAGQDR